jgi:para-aminobenzoate synthetase / 4-amino-4-deoxychorismate lyase
MTLKTQHSYGNTEDFSLLETILWENGEFFLLDRHLSRITKSADHFSYPVDLTRLLAVLNNSASGFNASGKHRVRLLLERSGQLKASSSAVSDLPPLPVRIVFSEEKTEKTDIFLRHKTTRRELYDRKLASVRKKGYFEIIFTNSEGEVTEGAFSNIIIKRGETYLTPPISSGVLPGTYREYLLDSHEIPLKEQVLYMDDVLAAENIFIVNSVIKMVAARL